MKATCLLLFMVGCSASPGLVAPEPSAPDVLRPRPHKREAIEGCHGDANEVVLDPARADRDAPIAIVLETHLHGDSPPSPTIAIWEDGHVLFAGAHEGKPQRMQATMPRDRAAAVTRAVFRTLDRVPRSTTVFGMTGGIVLEIMVRNGDRWRTVSLYGDEPERVLAVARGTAKPPAPKPLARTTGSFSIARELDERPWPPLGFAKAYQRLVEAVPAVGSPAVVHDYDISFVTPERGIEPLRPALAWPRDLPTVPARFDPTACHYNEGEDLDPSGGCWFMLAPHDNPAVERFKIAVRRDGRSRAVTINGHDVAIAFQRRYRGERTIDTVSACSNVLARRVREQGR